MPNSNPTQFRRFRVGMQGGYREGVFYPAGSLITLPDTDRPEDQPSDTWIPVGDKPEDLDDGAFGIAQRAVNPNPLPPTPASSTSFHSQGQNIPRREGEKTVGELKREKGGRTANVGAAQTDARNARTAAARTELDLQGGRDANEEAKRTHQAVTSFTPPAAEAPPTGATDEKDKDTKKKH